jgi:hypothetical protein
MGVYDDYKRVISGELTGVGADKKLAAPSPGYLPYPGAREPEGPTTPLGGKNKRSFSQPQLGYALGKAAQAVMGPFQSTPAAMLGGLGAEMNQNQAYKSTIKKLLAGESFENIPESAILAPEMLTIVQDTVEKTTQGKHNRMMDRQKYEIELRKMDLDEIEIAKRMEYYDSIIGKNKVEARKGEAEIAKTNIETNLIPRSTDEALELKTREARMLTNEQIKVVNAKAAADFDTFTKEFNLKQGAPLTPEQEAEFKARIGEAAIGSQNPDTAAEYVREMVKMLKGTVVPPPLTGTKGIWRKGAGGVREFIPNSVGGTPKG